jgi:ATP-dependent DNA ligase
VVQIRPMLADNKKVTPDILQRHLNEVGYLIMQPKIDGMRAMIAEDATARTRSWKLHKNRYLQKWASHHPSLRGLDGEVSSGHAYDKDTFRESMSGIRSEEGSPDFTFFVFDTFSEPYNGLTYEGRRTYAESVVAQLGPDQIADDYHCKLVMCPQKKVYTLDEINAYEEELLLAGWEGAILRRNDQPYKYNRSTNLGGALIKLKRFDDDEAVITGSYPWEVNDNEATLSALGYTVRSSHKDNKRVIDRLGGVNCHLLRDPSVTFDIGVFRGWSHSDRDRLWSIRDTLPGRILKFKHQGYGGGYDKPRTPVGLGFRDITDL